MAKRIVLFFAVLGLIVTACSRQEAATAVPQPIVTETAVAATPIPTPTAKPTATPQPTPVLPSISVADQPLTDDGEITIAGVVSTQPGWAVVYAMDDAGELGPILGTVPVKTGVNKALTLTIDPMQASQTLTAILHVDEGESGEFEYPDGPDEPLQWEGGIIADTFNLDFQVTLPSITVSAQEVGEDGLVTIESVTAPQPGWLVIQADDHGKLGAYLGSAPVQEGLNRDLTIPVAWREGTPTLYAVFYVDNGRPQRLDIPGEDVPLTINGQPVLKAFSATYPPDIYVLDQPIVDGMFEVERVISNGPGWLVAYFDDEGEAGLIIGSAPLKDDLNELVKVEVLETAVTPIIHLRLHEDTEPGDDFDFPRVDQPARYQDRLPQTVTFSTKPGNYLVVADQQRQPDDNSVTIPLVVVEEPAWLVIYADDNGRTGEIFGETLLSLGINRDVTVEIDSEKASDTLIAALHLDAGEIGEFEPDGPDVPLQRNRRPVQVTFSWADIGDSGD
ncbi:MAG TPA: hypothetical protein EYH05_00555 [Anaerolineae bacterium]|nr:hypothetical protein [Anaerolineae bacterium]